MPQSTVVHLPASYLPWMTGGKEIYTHSVARELQKQGWVNHVVIHQNPTNPEPLGKHELDGIQVHVLPPLVDKQRLDYYACRTRTNPGYPELLNELQPAIVHFHDFAQAVNLLHLEQSKAAGARTLMTYHSPGQSCLQRELLFCGNTLCDGEIRIDRCTECRLGVQGIPAWLRKPLSRISLPISGDTRLSRALTARNMTAAFSEAWQELVRDLDSIHVQAEWIRQLMLLNHVDEKKLAFFRSGLPFASNPPIVRPAKLANSPLHIIMLGRCERIKGQELLIDAVQSLDAALPVEVTFLGSYWDSTAYGQRCLKKIADDPRFHPPRKVPHDTIPGLLASADVMAVPSIWPETGPLVVLEAFAAGLPVVGSNLAGIGELVQHNQNGLLVKPDHVVDLATALHRLISEPGLLHQLQKNVTAPRTMAETAHDTHRLYQQLLLSALPK